MDSIQPDSTLSVFFRLCRMAASCVFLTVLFPASSAHAYRILFYHNSLDGTEGALLKCVDILRGAGHEVNVIDVKGRHYDPAGDNWGAPYDQVWDMRFVGRDPHTTFDGPSQPRILAG